MQKEENKVAPNQKSEIKYTLETLNHIKKSALFLHSKARHQTHAHPSIY